MKAAVKNVLNTLKRAPAAPPAPRPAIDYPVSGETLVSSHYAFRLSAPESVQSVDVSIDQGPWLACRKAEGFWWYDWTGFSDGDHELIARTPGKNGRFQMSARVQFKALR